MPGLSIGGVILAAIVNMVIGMIWYNPKVFGTQWMNLKGFKKKDLKMKKDVMRKTYAWAAIMAVATAWVMAYFIGIAEVETFIGGAFIGFLLWLGFVLTTSVNEVLWGKQSKEL